VVTLEQRPFPLRFSQLLPQTYLGSTLRLQKLCPSHFHVYRPSSLSFSSLTSELDSNKEKPFLASSELVGNPGSESFSRLLELSRSEWTLIGMSASTLAVTSSVTLLLPFASGSVIDIPYRAVAMVRHLWSWRLGCLACRLWPVEESFFGRCG
jgi:hypothetical protein